MPWTAQRGAGAVWRWVGEKPRRPQPLGQRDECDLRLDPRQRSSHAVVQAAAEPEVLVVRAVGIEAVRIGEAQRVAAAGREQEYYRRPSGIVVPPIAMSARASRVR